MHVVVHRRGLENGEWLKVSLRSDIHYDRMREVLVDVAEREGIELEATPRLARGIHDRAIPDAEYRRAGLERRDPVAAEHSPETAIRSAAGLIHYARRAAAEAREIELTDPEQAERLRAAGLSLGEGRELTPTVWGLPEPPERTGEPAGLRALAERETEAFARRDAEALEVEGPVERTRLMREIAALKAEARPELGRHGKDLDPYTVPDDSRRYDALAGTGREDGLTAKMTNQRIAFIAARYGVDGDATVERFSGDVPSRGLAMDFRIAEMLERDASRIEAGETVETADATLAANLRMHEEIDAVHELVRAGRSPYADVTDRLETENRAQDDRVRSEQAARDEAGHSPGDVQGRNDADRLEDMTEEVGAKFARLDADAQDIEDHATRMRFLREIAEIKVRTAAHMRDPDDLHPFTERDDSGAPRKIGRPLALRYR